MPGKHRNRRSFASPSRGHCQRLTERERTEILTLFAIAKWSKQAIARELRIARSTVINCIKQGFHTPFKAPGRKPKLTTMKRKFLIARATQNAEHRRKT